MKNNATALRTHNLNYCADCKQYGKWVRSPENDNTIQECWICTNCESKTYVPNENHPVHFGELD